LANVLTNRIKRHSKNIQLNKPKQISTINTS